MGDGGAGDVRWNKETQSWERVGAGGHPPRGPHRPGRRLVWGVLGGAAAVGVAVALVLTLVAGDGEDAGARAPSGTVEAPRGGEGTPPPGGSAGTAPASEDPLAGASGPPEVPAGYRAVDDPGGFSTVVPEGWTRSEKNGGAVVFYTAPDERGGLLQIFEVVEVGYTPDKALDIAVQSLSREPGFEVISRGPVSAEADASELVYEYDSAEVGERVKAVDRVFTTDDGRLYAMIVRGTADDWAATRETFEIARAAFTPN